MKKTTFPLLALFCLTGCQGEVLDVPTAGGGNGGGSSTEASAEHPIVYTGYGPSSLASGNDRIKIVFTALSEKNVEGTITFGDETKPLPPMDPTKAYPPEAGEGSIFSIATFEGYPYPLALGKLEGKRLRFGVVDTGPYRGWCEAQESFLQPDGASYGCTRYNNSSLFCGESPHTTCLSQMPGLPDDVVEPSHWVACNVFPGLCACDATGCEVGPTSPSLDWDLRFDGDELNGKFNTSGEVFLTREN